MWTFINVLTATYLASYLESMSSANPSLEVALAAAKEKCNGINDMTETKEAQLSQLMVACLHGNPDDVLQALLEIPGIQVDLQNDEGWHAFMYACALGHIQVAQ